MVFYFSKFPSAFSQNLNWVKQIPGTGSDYLKSMTSDANGNIYLVGAFTGTIDFGSGSSAGPAVGSDIWFGKYSSTGNLIWAHGLVGGDDDFGWDIALDNSGNVYITGYFGTTTAQLDFDPGTGTAFPSVSHGLFIAKYSNTGAFQWVKTIGANLVTTRSYAIALDSFGDVYIGGQIWSTTTQNVDFNPGTGVNNLSTSNGSIFFAKYNGGSGNYVWARNVGPGNTANTDLWDLFIDASNYIYITGRFTGSADFHPTANSPILNSSSGGAYVCKYNVNGGYVWTKQVSGQNGDIGRRLAVDGSNNVYVTGTYNTNGENIFLAKFNSSGTQQALKSIGGTNSDAGHALTLDGSGNLYLTGFFNGTNINFNAGGPPISLTSSGSFHNFFYGKYRLSDLDCQWVRRVDFNLDLPDYEMNAIRLVSNKIVVAGNFKGTGDFTTCSDYTQFNASTIDSFLAGYNTSESAFYISGGLPEVCEPGPVTFYAYNVPLGATVYWTASPGTLVTPTSGIGSSFTVTVLPGVSGTVSVSATIPGECGSTAYASFTIGLGDGAACSPSNLVLEPCATLYAQTCSGGPLYNWYIDGNLVLTTDVFYAYISLILNPVAPGYHSLCVEYANSCGGGPQACTTFFSPDCGGGQQYMMGYPNPTQQQVNFVLEPGGKETVDFEYSYTLVDKNAATVKNGTTRKNALVIDVGDLMKGTYIFKVYLPNQRIEQRIVIE
jgi:hypothetical protein